MVLSCSFGSHACNQVNVNGAISFGSEVQYTSDPFPLDKGKIVAPFWADVDTSSGGGEVWYHESKSESNLKRAASEIRAAYPYQVPSDFKVTNLFIATWKEVGYYNQKKDKVDYICACT